MVRFADMGDIDRIVEMAEKFYPNTRYHAAGIPLKKDCAAGLAILMIKTSTLLVAESSDGNIVGMVGSYIDPFTFNDDYLIAKEIVWWVDPDHQLGGHGRSLLIEHELACKDAGAKLIVMMDLADNPVATQIYRGMGYYHSENSWTKVI